MNNAQSPLLEIVASFENLLNAFKESNSIIYDFEFSSSKNEKPTDIGIGTGYLSLIIFKAFNREFRLDISLDNPPKEHDKFVFHSFAFFNEYSTTHTHKRVNA